MEFGRASTSLPSGETILRAAKALAPLHESIEVSVSFGNNPKERARWGATPEKNAPKIEIQIGVGEASWVEPKFAGFQFSRDDFGRVFIFEGSGVKGSRFDSVRIRTPVELKDITVSWTNWRW